MARTSLVRYSIDLWKTWTVLFIFTPPWPVKNWNESRVEIQLCWRKWLTRSCRDGGMCTCSLSDNWGAVMKKKLYTTHNNERAHYLALLKKKKNSRSGWRLCHCSALDYSKALLCCCRERMRNWKWYVSWKKRSLHLNPSFITYNIPDLTKITLSFWISIFSSLTWKSYYLLFYVTELWRSNVLMNAKEPFKS